MVPASRLALASSSTACSKRASGFSARRVASASSILRDATGKRSDMRQQGILSVVLRGLLLRTGQGKLAVFLGVPSLDLATRPLGNNVIAGLAWQGPAQGAQWQA